VTSDESIGVPRHRRGTFRIARHPSPATSHLTSAQASVKAITRLTFNQKQYQANPAARDLREACGGVAVFSPVRG